MKGLLIAAACVLLGAVATGFGVYIVRVHGKVILQSWSPSGSGCIVVRELGIHPGDVIEVLLDASDKEYRCEYIPDKGMPVSSAITFYGGSFTTGGSDVTIRWSSNEADRYSSDGVDAEVFFYINAHFRLVHGVWQEAPPADVRQFQSKGKDTAISKTVEARKGILVNGISTDVEIKALEPAVYVGLNVDSQRLAEIDGIPELRAFARMKHAEHLSLNDYRSLACRSAQGDLTNEAFQACIKDEQTYPERHHIWARYFVFITQRDLKALFICYNFEEKTPSGSLTASPYIWEDGAWKSWAADFEKQRELEHAFDVNHPNNPATFFREKK